jgi:hypothetical protein
MDRDTAVRVIKQKCGFRQNAERDNQIVAALQQSQQLLEQGGLITEAGFATELPWFLKVYDQEIALPADTNEVNLPSNFLREAEDEGPWFPDTSVSGEPPIYLEKAGSGVSRRTFTGTTLGPQIYDVRTTTLYIYPASDEALTLKWTYFAKDTVLTGNVENGWLKYVPSLLIGHAGQGFAADLRDAEAAKEFSRMKVEGQKQLLIANVSREMTNRRTSIGRYR